MLSIIRAARLAKISRTSSSEAAPAIICSIARLSVCGVRLADDGLRDPGLEMLDQLLVELGRGTAAFVADELDQHRLRDDGAGVASDLADSLLEQADIRLGLARIIFADAQRQAIDLKERDPVLQRIVGEEIGPGGGAGEAPADRQARLRRVDMGDIFERLQRLGHAAIPAQHKRVAVDLVELEPARIAPEQLRGQPQLVGFPDDLGCAVALADRVEDIEQLELQRVALQPVADQLCVGLRFRVVAGGIDIDRQLRHGALPRAHDAEIVKIFLLHFLGELKILCGVTRLGAAQQLRQPPGRQSLGGMARRDLAHADERRAGDLALQVVAAQRQAVLVDQDGHGIGIGIVAHRPHQAPRSKRPPPARRPWRCLKGSSSRSARSNGSGFGTER